MTHSILQEGTTVRVVSESSSGDSDIDASAALPTCLDYTVYAYAGPGEGDDPNGSPYYLLDIAGQSAGGCYWAYPENVRPVHADCPMCNDGDA